MKKIAFLTTVFPMEKVLLYDFFNSLEEQTYNKFDIIVVNDGCTDFEEINSIHNKNLNIIELICSDTPSKNREYGINYCIDNNYDVLIFGDSDDYFASNRVEKSIELLKDNDIVVNDLTLFDKNGIYEEKYISNRVKNNSIIDFNFIKNKNIFGLTNTALNLKNIEKVSFDKELVVVDWFLFKKLLEQGLVAIFTNETISFYRQYNNNTVGLGIKNGTYYFWWEKK